MREDVKRCVYSGSPGRHCLTPFHSFAQRHTLCETLPFYTINHEKHCVSRDLFSII